MTASQQNTCEKVFVRSEKYPGNLRLIVIKNFFCLKSDRTIIKKQRFKGVVFLKYSIDESVEQIEKRRTERMQKKSSTPAFYGSYAAVVYALRCVISADGFWNV